MLRHALYVTNLEEFFLLPTRPEPPHKASEPSFQGGIEFHNVSFSYPDSPKPTLTNISFDIKPGEAVALVGKNGAGKTTLVKLIGRFYQPDSGKITCNGVALSDFSTDFFYRHIAFVFQNSTLYEASVADNIAYGDWPSLLTNREKIQEIARYTGVDKLIEKTPNGYDTLLGRQFGEHDLSGGQWQQIVIARAFARQARLLILDEPSSNLDAEAEAELFARFRHLAKDKTTILISHRFSTVKMADRIIVLDKGRVVEIGTHQELIAQQGLYATLYELQRQQIEV
jgi:ATP-binding cassette subfamily B protein